MKFQTQLPLLTDYEKKRSQEILQSNHKIVANAAKELLPHRDWLEGLKRAAEQAAFTPHQ
jgi:hypothetical protein